MKLMPLHGRTCFARGRYGRTCDHARQRHHVVKQQHIRAKHASLRAAHRRGGPKPWKLSKALADPRLWRWICWSHHQLETSGKLRVEKADLPPGFWDAVAEYGLERHVPAHLSDD